MIENRRHDKKKMAPVKKVSGLFRTASDKWPALLAVWLLCEQHISIVYSRALWGCQKCCWNIYSVSQFLLAHNFTNGCAVFGHLIRLHTHKSVSSSVRGLCRVFYSRHIFFAAVTVERSKQVEMKGWLKLWIELQSKLVKLFLFRNMSCTTVFFYVKEKVGVSKYMSTIKNTWTLFISYTLIFLL